MGANSSHFNKEDDSAVGIRCNRWRRPICQFGRDEVGLERRLKNNDFVGAFNFDEKTGDKAADLVNLVLKLFLQRVKSGAQMYEGLVIDKYVYQGSSRDGLKVGAPNEFDAMLQFCIEGLQIKPVGLQNSSGKTVAELGKIVVLNSQETLRKRYPTLFRKGVFDFDSVSGKCFLSSRKLYERVFESLVDKAAKDITDEVLECVVGGQYHFRIERKVNPPSVNITIYVNDTDITKLRQMIVPESIGYPKYWGGQKIDIDIVPGILVGREKVPDPATFSGYMDCPRHYVFKWKQENQKTDITTEHPSLLWRVCTSGYELYLLDVSRRYEERKYILTALRILKMYFIKAKEQSNVLFSQVDVKIANILRSYHLKHIAFYCILFLCVEGDISITGVKEAMGYMVELLQVTLEEGHLPHFFHSNPNLTKMLPYYDCSENFLSFDLYGMKSSTSIQQSRASLKNNLRVHLRDAITYPAGRKADKLKERFRNHIRTRTYFGDIQQPPSPTFGYAYQPRNFICYDDTSSDSHDSLPEASGYSASTSAPSTSPGNGWKYLAGIGLGIAVVGVAAIGLGSDSKKKDK